MMNQDWLLGFFFIASDEIKAPELYFACFQKGLTDEAAHQIVIAGTGDHWKKFPKVAYIVNPWSLTSFDEATLEELCRIAISQFLSKLPRDNFLAQVLPLDLTRSPWRGATAPLTNQVASVA